MFWNKKNSNAQEINHIKQETLKEFYKQTGQWEDKARKYLDNPQEARQLLNAAAEKARQNMKGPLQDIWDSLQTLFSLLKDWISGEYRIIPTKSILLLIAGIVYFVTPIDIIPEFIAGLGLLDDAMVLSFIIGQLSNDLDDYKAWKSRQGK